MLGLHSLLLCPQVAKINQYRFKEKVESKFSELIELEKKLFTSSCLSQHLRFHSHCPKQMNVKDNHLCSCSDCHSCQATGSNLFTSRLEEAKDIVKVMRGECLIHHAAFPSVSMSRWWAGSAPLDWLLSSHLRPVSARQRLPLGQ